MGAPLILVTGAGGYGGRWLVTRLLDAGYRVRGADIREPRRGASGPIDDCSRWDERAQFVICDVRRDGDVEMAVRGCDVVVHAAAIVPYNLGRAFTREALWEVNVRGTQRVFDAARAAGVRSFVLASSTGVVFRGAAIAGGDESLPLPPLPADLTDSAAACASYNDVYSASKAAAEAYVLRESAADGLAAVALRPNGIWGPGEQHHIPKLWVVAQLGASGSVFGDGAHTDFTHRENLAHAFVCAVAALRDGRRSRVAGRAYFVTDGWPVHTMEQFAGMLSACGFTTPYPSGIVVVPRTTSAALEPPALTPARSAVAVGTARRRRSGSSSVSSVVGAASAVARGAAVDTLAAPLLGAPMLPAADGRVPPAAFAALAASGHLLPWSAITQAALDEPPSAADAGPVDYRIVTSDPPWYAHAPAAAAWFTAAVLEIIAALLSPFVSLEPFLTRADFRKVVRDNWYRSDAAARDLGYRPPMSPARGIMELAVYYRDVRGYNGAIASPPPAVWVAVLVGMACNGAIGFDVGGVGSLAFNAVADAAGKAGAWAGLRGDVLMAIRLIFCAAVITHAINAAWAARFAWRHHMAATSWCLQTLLLGFPSTTLLLKQAGGDWLAWAPRAPIISFAIMIATTAALMLWWLLIAR